MIRAALALFLLATPAHADLAGSMLAKVGQGRPHGCPPRLWCACFAGKVLSSAGYKRLQSNRAIDYRHYGKAVSGFARNTIVVFPHHVGVATGNSKACSAGKVQIVSGNSGNRVRVGCYSKARVVATRRAVK